MLIDSDGWWSLIILHFFSFTMPSSSQLGVSITSALITTASAASFPKTWRRCLQVQTPRCSGFLKPMRPCILHPVYYYQTASSRLRFWGIIPWSLSFSLQKTRGTLRSSAGLLCGSWRKRTATSALRKSASVRRRSCTSSTLNGAGASGDTRPRPRTSPKRFPPPTPSSGLGSS